MASHLGNIDQSHYLETEIVPGSILASILESFPTQKNGNILLGNQEFTLDEIKKGKLVSGGSMHTVIILPERELVLKFNKPGIIGDSYVDMQMQHGAFLYIKEYYPELEFHFPETQIIPSETVDEAYAIVMEQVVGQTMTIADSYNRALHKQIKDLRSVFYILLTECNMPIGLDIMGAKEGFRCFLFGLEVIDNFNLGNLIVTDDGRIVMIDSGLSLSTMNNFIKNAVNGSSIFGQIATIEHMYAIACEKGESFIR